PPRCACHVLKERTTAIRRAVAKVRKQLAARKPAGKRGRPTTGEAKRLAGKRPRREQKRADPLAQRHPGRQHAFTAARRRTLPTIRRGLRELRTLRAIREEV